MLDFLRCVVGVAKWLRRQVVALEIEGSNPSAHPIPPAIPNLYPPGRLAHGSMGSPGNPLPLTPYSLRKASDASFTCSAWWVHRMPTSLYDLQPCVGDAVS